MLHQRLQHFLQIYRSEPVDNALDRVGGVGDCVGLILLVLTVTTMRRWRRWWHCRRGHGSKSGGGRGARGKDSRGGWSVGHGDGDGEGDGASDSQERGENWRTLASSASLSNSITSPFCCPSSLLSERGEAGSRGRGRAWPLSSEGEERIGPLTMGLAANWEV